MEIVAGVLADEPGITSEPVVTDPLVGPPDGPGILGDPPGFTTSEPEVTTGLSVIVPVGIVTVPGGATTIELDGWLSVGWVIVGGATTTAPELGTDCAGVDVMVGGLIGTA